MAQPHLDTRPDDLDPVIEAYKKHVDRTLIRENLRLTVQERFDKLERMSAFAGDLRRAMQTAQGRQ